MPGKQRHDQRSEITEVFTRSEPLNELYAPTEEFRLHELETKFTLLG
jgi:hypothetical protein